MPRQYQTPRHELLARRDKSALPYPAHSKADVKAARNLLYLQGKGVLPISRELGPRYAVVIQNDNLRRDNRRAELRHNRQAALFLLCPTIER